MKLGIRELIWVTLMLGMLAATYFYVLRPEGQEGIDIQADTARKKKELTDLRLMTSGISDIERKNQELAQAIRFFEQKLPQQKDLDNILKEVWQLAEKNNLQTRTIKTVKGERAAGYCDQPITMGLAGDFKGFYSFLLQLEKLPRLTQLTHMKLDRSPERDGAMQAQLTLSIFFESADGKSSGN